jgi:hypothetical protein
MSKKSDLELLQKKIKDAVIEFDITELDNGTINWFAENILNNDFPLAQQIIANDIDADDLRNMLDDFVTDVTSTAECMELHGDVEVDGLEPHWDDEDDDEK